MKLALLAALAQLDPTNANHWTGEGLPRLDTVKFLTGNNSLTREMITEAAPSLTRQNPLQAAQAADSGQGSQEGAFAAPAAPQAPSQAQSQGDGNGAQQAGPGLDADPQVDAVNETIAEEDELVVARRALDAARAAQAATTREVETASAAVDRIVEAREAAQQEQDAGSPVRGYLNTQAQLLQERAERIKALRGVDLKSLLPQRSPIDEAFRRKNARGTARPVSL